MLLEIGDRSVTLLDGDIVRKRLSSELGFSKNHRDINIRRIGYNQLAGCLSVKPARMTAGLEYG